MSAKWTRCETEISPSFRTCMPGRQRGGDCDASRIRSSRRTGDGAPVNLRIPTISPLADARRVTAVGVLTWSRAGLATALLASVLGCSAAPALATPSPDRTCLHRGEHVIARGRSLEIVLSGRRSSTVAGTRTYACVYDGEHRTRLGRSSDDAIVLRSLRLSGTFVAFQEESTGGEDMASNLVVQQARDTSTSDSSTPSPPTAEQGSRSAASCSPRPEASSTRGDAQPTTRRGSTAASPGDARQPPATAPQRSRRSWRTTRADRSPPTSRRLQAGRLG
jgi:hypothetical protein